MNLIILLILHHCIEVPKMIVWHVKVKVNFKDYIRLD